MDYLRNEPSSITELTRLLDCEWGTARHHIYLLENAGLVMGVRIGRERRFFAAENGRITSDSNVLALMTSLDKHIVQAILKSPGIIQKELLHEIGLSRKVFRQHMDVLVQEGLIDEISEAKMRKYYPAPALHEGAHGHRRPFSAADSRSE